MMQVELSLSVLILIFGHFGLVLFILYRNKSKFMYTLLLFVCINGYLVGQSKQDDTSETHKNEEFQK